MKIVNTALGLRRSLRAQVPDAQPPIQDSTAPQEDLDNHSQLTKYPSRGEDGFISIHPRYICVFPTPQNSSPPAVAHYLFHGSVPLPGDSSHRYWSYPEPPSSASLIQSTCELGRALQSTPVIHSFASVTVPTQAGNAQLPNWAPGFHACLCPILLAPEPEGSCKHVAWTGEASVP